MINLVLPLSSVHGWGMFGRYVTRELMQHDQVRLFTNSQLDVLMPLEKRLLGSVATVVPEGPIQKFTVDGPVLQVVTHDFVRAMAEVNGSTSVACIFF